MAAQWFLLALLAHAIIASTGADNSSPGLLSDPATAPPGIVSDCARAQQRCTRCHDSDRIVAARHRSKSQWMGVVDRMRRRPSSGISPGDTAPIVRCLVYRSNTRGGS